MGQNFSAVCVDDNGCIYYDPNCIIGFAETQATEISLIKSLCFIPFDVGAGVIQPLVRVGWTLNCEMFFYLIFWISFHIPTDIGRGSVRGSLF